MNANDVKLSDVLDELPVLVRRTRNQRHLSIRQAAEQIGMDYGALSHFEIGYANPTMATLRKIAAWLEDDPYLQPEGGNA